MNLHKNLINQSKPAVLTIYYHNFGVEFSWTFFIHPLIININKNPFLR